jgi:hypothetical protein
VSRGPSVVLGRLFGWHSSQRVWMDRKLHLPTTVVLRLALDAIDAQKRDREISVSFGDDQRMCISTDLQHFVLVAGCSTRGIQTALAMRVRAGDLISLQEHGESRQAIDPPSRPFSSGPFREFGAAMGANDLELRLRVRKGAAYHDLCIPSPRVEGIHFDGVVAVLLYAGGRGCHRKSIGARPPTDQSIRRYTRLRPVRFWSTARRYLPRTNVRLALTLACIGHTSSDLLCPHGDVLGQHWHLLGKSDRRDTPCGQSRVWSATGRRMSTF